MKFIITVDTEADNQWKRGRPITLRNIECLPRFQTCVETYGFIPTYLITHEVAVDPGAKEILSKWSNDGRAEIGSHLHPWTTPPYRSEEEKQRRDFPSSLAPQILRDKLKILTEAVKNVIGANPTSFRAGRFGVNEDVLKALYEFGYIVDASVTPGVNWQKITKGREVDAPNFKGEALLPHERCGLTELPMTVVRTPFLQRLKWCRIFPETTISDLIKVYKIAKKGGLPYIQFLIHSSELLVGGSPYSKTAEQVEHIYTVLNEFMAYLKAEGVTGETLTSFVKTSNS